MPRHPILTDELLSAALDGEARPDLAARSPRFFHHERHERLTRAHPASPYVLYVPAIAGCLWLAAALSLPARVALLAGGWLCWTFIEYWLHRGFFHMRAGAPAVRVTSFIIHRHHHAAPQDQDRLVATPLYSLGLFLLLFPVYSLAGPDARWALMAGSMLGYLAYELAHWRAHHVRPGRHGPVGRWLRRHHLRHHFGDDTHNFGISSPLWDLVFRTWRTGPVQEDSRRDP